MSCNTCNSLQRKISSPNELENAIYSLINSIDQNEIKYLGKGDWGDDFNKFRQSMSWGDLVQNYFECNKCSQIIELGAETYHGSGGSVKHINYNEMKINKP